MSSIYTDHNNKVAFITGGPRGIGTHTTQTSATKQTKTCIVDRDKKALDLDLVVGEITTAGGTSIGAVADVTESQLGPADILATFAGGQGHPVPSVELTEERWRQVIDSNLTSAFLTTRTFLPGMLERGNESIITMSSTAGREPSQANPAYGVANAAWSCSHARWRPSSDRAESESTPSRPHPSSRTG